MARITIELPEVGSPEFKKLSQPQSRLFSFPDQIERVITLPGRYWKAYDTLDSAWGFCGDYEQASYDWTLEEVPAGHPDFEAWLRYFFALCIRAGWDRFQQGERGSVNENLL